MTSISFAQRAAKVHPAIILATSATLAWVGSSLLTGNTSPAEARPSSKASRVPAPAPSSFDNLPARLPGRLDGSAPIAQTAPSSVVGMSTPSPSGGDGGSGGSQSQRSAKPPSAGRGCTRRASSYAGAEARSNLALRPVASHDGGSAGARPDPGCTGLCAAAAGGWWLPSRPVRGF